ncbi:MAG: hypothetical protein E7325_00435 [Clostridiales bacterium]|jgi:threonine/homoserine/homoserine lactone efflux protein|nr:hypothetical protein [Clostridiales bacterium]
MKGNYNPNIHATLLAAVGAYLLYLAWTLLDKYRSGANEMDPFWNIAAVIVFALGGLGTIWYAWTVYRKSRREEKEKDAGNNDENP